LPSFLFPLEENSIYQIVQIVEPQNSHLIIDYARTLDKRSVKNALQGQAGSEFRLLKWQIIFPILLENRGALFNYKYFVRDILLHVAAHYNLTFVDVLAYIWSDMDELRLTSGLRAVFNSLWKETHSKEKQEIKKDPAKELLIRRIRKQKLVFPEDVRELKWILKDPGSRKKLFHVFTDEDHAFILTTILPSESRFIRQYVTGLNKQKTEGILADRSVDEYNRIKWEFIYEVLVDSGKQVFNRKYLVEYTLKKLASHYNLTVQKLLVSFYNDQTLMTGVFAFDLHLIIRELYFSACQPEKTPERSQPENFPVRERKEEDQKRATRDFLYGWWGNGTEFRKELELLSNHSCFIHLIKDLLEIEKKLFLFLCETVQVRPDRKQLLHLLLRFAGEYRSLSRAEIMSELITLLTATLTIEQYTSFLNEIYRLEKSDFHLLSLFTQVMKKESTGSFQEEKMDLLSVPENPDRIWVEYAGIVLLSPYLPILFTRLGLIGEENFMDTDSKIKAVFLLHYLVTGKIEMEEPYAFLYRILTGMENTIPLPRVLELTGEEKEIALSLLQNVLRQWEKLQNTSVAGLRESFLQRSGMLLKQDDHWLLTIEEKTYDILIDWIPWSFKMIRYSWMDQLIRVKWR